VTLRLTFRPFSNDLQQELMDLWVVSWSEVYASIDFEARRDWFAEHMAEWIRTGGSRIGAFGADGQLAGFILLDQRNGHLDQFCVRRDMKGAGVGEAMMIETKRLSPAGITLDVNAMNTRAIRFYEREGFIKTGEGVNPTSGLPTFHYHWRP
jgi:putative acetyltransferase